MVSPFSNGAHALMARCATDVANNAKNAGALKGYMWANKGTLIWATPTNLDMVESAADVKAAAKARQVCHHVTV